MNGETAAFLAAAGSACIGLAALLWALRVTDGARGAMAALRDRIKELEDKVARADALFGALPGALLVWEDAYAQGDENDNWGSPRLYGSPLALASLLRFSDASGDADPAVRILQGLSRFHAHDVAGAHTRLAPALARLRREGAAFSHTISTPMGVFLELDGRTAGGRVALWITDSSARGVAVRGADWRFKEGRRAIAQDPTSFLEMLSDAPLLAWRVSSGLKLEWANAAYLNALEARSLDQAIERNLALDAAAAEQARKVLETGEAIEETRYVVVRGERRSLKIAMSPVAGGVGAIATDMTEGEAAREALSRQAKAHDETLNHLAEGVAVFGPDKKLVFYNRAFVEMWGLDKTFVAERPTHGAWLDYLKEQRRLPAHANYPEWRAGELAHYQDVSHLPEALWVLPEGRTIKVTRQRHPLGGLLLIFSDVTNELTLRSQYNALLAVQKAAIENLHEAVAVFGLDGRMKLRNSAFTALWELGDELPDQDAPFDRFVEATQKLYHDRATWAQIRARITDPSPQARKEYHGEMQRSDGVVLHFLTRPLPDGQTLVAFLDITAARKVEQALRDRAGAFEEADKLKTVFVRNVSHHLRNPLHGVLFASDMLHQELFGPLNDRQKEHVGAIQDAARQLEKLVGNILDVAMVDAGEVDLNLTPVDLHAAVTEAAELAQARAEDSEVRVKVDCAEDIGAIEADEKRVRQILFNLVANAMGHTEPGDTVIVGAERDETEARLYVSDSGRGIPLEEQARVFDAFQSGDQRGAGLGLALVRSFVTLHGGWVSLRSEPGMGTTVTCHFPLRAAGTAKAA